MKNELAKLAMIIAGFIGLKAVNKLLESSSSKKEKSKKNKPGVFGPVNFGFKSQWVAVSTDDTTALIDYLQLKLVVKCSWDEGIKGNGKTLFVTPPIDGWSLLSGWSLPIRNQIEYEQFLNDLSTEFGESQYFANHGGSSSAAWMKSIRGVMQRVYYVGDGQTYIKGGATEVEKDYDLYDARKAQEGGEEYWENALYPDYEQVFEVARAWSVDPSQLAGRKDLRPFGYQGKIRTKW